jgi:hypothetical protein
MTNGNVIEKKSIQFKFARLAFIRVKSKMDLRPKRAPTFKRKITKQVSNACLRGNLSL